MGDIKVPSFEELMLQILRLMSDDKQRRNNDIKQELVPFMRLSDEQLAVRNNNGNVKFFDNCGFAISYLYMANLLGRPQRAVYKITDTGKDVASKNISSINVSYLKEISPEFKSRIEQKNVETNISSSDKKPSDDDMQPEDKMRNSASIIKESVKKELLDNLIKSTPGFFEKVCRDLMLALGYGYDFKDSGIVTQLSNDGGIDGIIYADKLGLEKIYIQAKRFDIGNNIGRPLLQAFKGAIDNSKGVFITTSDYSKDALLYAEKYSNLILINGDKLVELLYANGVGVKVRETFVSKEVDQSYFEDLN